MLIAQLSDSHIGLDPAVLGGHVDTTAALHRAVAHVARLVPAPDAVLLTGDLADAGQAADYATLAAALRALRQPVYAVAGNHDLPAIAQAGLGAAMPVAADAPAGCTCYHVALGGLGGLRLVALDTVVAGQAHGRLDAAQLAWLARTLRDHAADPVLIAMHHPPLRTGIDAMDRCGLREGTAELAALVQGHGRVQGILCGHVHRPIHGMLGGAPVHVAPSVAHQIALDLRPGAALACRLEPPKILLHRWSAHDGLCTHLSYVDEFAGPFAL